MFSVQQTVCDQTKVAADNMQHKDNNNKLQHMQSKRHLLARGFTTQLKKEDRDYPKSDQAESHYCEGRCRPRTDAKNA